MKRRTGLALVAATLFGLSFALPADGNMSGWECFTACWRVFTEFGKDHDTNLGGWCYYSGFVLANILFVVLFGALLCGPGRMRLRFWMSTVATLQVFSWLVLNLFSHGDRFELGLGYFVWLLSFILLLIAHGIRSGSESHTADPALAPGTDPDAPASHGL